MYINEKMSKNVVSVKADSLVSKAYQLMVETKHSKLPVVDDENKLVGIITDRLIEEVNPHRATSLSEYEINHLLSKIKVMEIMNTGVFKIKENSFIEDAALIMKENKISFLPVINDDNKVSGIVSRTDVFKAFIDVLGIKATGTRISIKSDKIAEIVSLISNENIEILSLTNVKLNDKSELVIKVSALELEKLMEKLKSNDYEVTSVIKHH